MIRQSILLSLGCFLTLSSSCTSKRTDGAGLLQEAKEAYDDKSYGKALKLLDSLRRNYPLDTTSLRQSIPLTRQIRYDSVSVELATLRPSLDRVKNEIDALLPSFAPLGEEQSIYVHKAMNSLSDANAKRNYLYWYIHRDGGLEPVSVYHGAKAINHSSIQVDTIRLLDVPYDGILNYRYRTDDTFHETVTFTTPPNDSIRISRFMATLLTSPQPKIKYLSNGQVVYVYTPTKADIQIYEQSQRLHEALQQQSQGTARIGILEALIQKNAPQQN